MRVVYTPIHLAHDITHETIMGVSVPANEVAERAERIRAALESDGGFELSGPTEHGEAPITAVHDEGLVRFLENAFAGFRGELLPRPALIPEGFGVAGLVEGMDPALLRAPDAASSGWAGRYALDTSTPIVAGTWVAARASVDVALTTVDLVLDQSLGYVPLIRLGTITSQGQFHLGSPALKVETQGHKRQAFLLHLSRQLLSTDAVLNDQQWHIWWEVGCQVLRRSCGVISPFPPDRAS